MPGLNKIIEEILYAIMFWGACSIVIGALPIFVRWYTQYIGDGAGFFQYLTEVPETLLIATIITADGLGRIGLRFLKTFQTLRAGGTSYLVQKWYFRCFYGLTFIGLLLITIFSILLFGMTLNTNSSTFFAGSYYLGAILCGVSAVILEHIP